MIFVDLEVFQHVGNTQVPGKPQYGFEMRTSSKTSVNQLSTRRSSSSSILFPPGSAMQSVGEVMAIGRTFEVGLIRKSFPRLINPWQFPSKIRINLTQQKTEKRLGLDRLVEFVI